jgi:tetratricopeptide (TPR) repeat protein
MCDLAVSYSALERHQEALEMEEKALEFQRRVLPENYPDIGEEDALIIISFALFKFDSGLSLYNISCSYEQAGDLDRAMECARESLRVWQTALPPGHQDIVDAEKSIRRLERQLEADDDEDDAADEDAREDEDDI